jgi:hypothetical protein
VQQTTTTVFGQYAFDGLAMGRYTLRVGGKTLLVEITPSQAFVMLDIASE